MMREISGFLCSLPSDLELSQTTDNSPGLILQRALISPWMMGREKSAEHNYVESYWQNILPTEVWL